MRIAPRTEWGGPAEPIGHPTSGAKLLVVIHHSHRPHLDCGVTEESEQDAILGMHRYHAGKGWGGISYNFLVFQSGNVYEGRGWNRVGAHTVGRNSSSVGICLVMDGEAHAPTKAAIEATMALVTEGVRLGHIAPTHARAPHDRFQQKVCPGQRVKDSGLISGAVPPVERGAAVAPFPTLRLGSGGKNAPADIFEAVRELQRRLGMPAHLRTGYFGSRTTEYVKEYQAARGLMSDGIVGPVTWAALGQGV